MNSNFKSNCIRGYDVNFASRLFSKSWSPDWVNNGYCKKVTIAGKPFRLAISCSLVSNGNADWLVTNLEDNSVVASGSTLTRDEALSSIENWIREYKANNPWNCHWHGNG